MGEHRVTRKILLLGASGLIGRSVTDDPARPGLSPHRRRPAFLDFAKGNIAGIVVSLGYMAGAGRVF